MSRDGHVIIYVVLVPPCTEGQGLRSWGLPWGRKWYYQATPAGRLRASREVSKLAIAGAQGLGPQRQSPLRPGASEVILEACLSS